MPYFVYSPEKLESDFMSLTIYQEASLLVYITGYFFYHMRRNFLPNHCNKAFVRLLENYFVVALLKIDAGSYLYV